MKRGTLQNKVGLTKTLFLKALKQLGPLKALSPLYLYPCAQSLCFTGNTSRTIVCACEDWQESSVHLNTRILVGKPFKVVMLDLLKDVLYWFEHASLHPFSLGHTHFKCFAQLLVFIAVAMLFKSSLHLQNKWDHINNISVMETSLHLIKLT